MYLFKHHKRLIVDKIINGDSDMSFAAVAAGSNIGEVWVDDVSCPTFVMVWSEYFRLYFTLLCNSYLRHIP